MFATGAVRDGALVFAVSLRVGARIDARQLGAPRARPLKEIVRDVELAAVSQRLRSFGYARSETARRHGLTREGLWHTLRQLGLAPPRRAT